MHIKEIIDFDARLCNLQIFRDEIKKNKLGIVQTSINYRKVASSNTSHIEAHAAIYRLLMEVILDAYDF